MIINSMEPGMVKTEIQRHVLEHSPALQFLGDIFVSAVFKTPENGARILIMGGLTTEEENVSLDTMLGFFTQSQHATVRSL